MLGGTPFTPFGGSLVSKGLPVHRRALEAEPVLWELLGLHGQGQAGPGLAGQHGSLSTLPLGFAGDATPGPF